MSAAVPRREVLVLIWLAALVVLGSMLLASRLARTGGDDADPGRQRPGILDLGSLPEPAPALQPDVPEEGSAALVFFAGRGTARRLCDAVAAMRPDVRGADVIVVASEPAACPGFVTVVDDVPVERAARAYGLPATRDRGEPAGYAVVDAEGRIRYRTLDPSVVGLLDEAVLILAAVR